MDMVYVKALIDPQVDFVSGVFGTEEAQAIAGRWAGFLTAPPDGAKSHLFFVTRDSHPAPYGANPESRLFAAPHCVEGTEGCGFVKPVADALRAQERNPAYRVCEKNGFVCLDLPDAIAAAASDCSLAFGAGGEGLDIAICGVVTDICVLTNAVFLQARFPWAKISVDASGCAGTTPDNHANALRIIRGLGIGVAD